MSDMWQGERRGRGGEMSIQLVGLTDLSLFLKGLEQHGLGRSCANRALVRLCTWPLTPSLEVNNVLLGD